MPCKIRTGQHQGCTAISPKKNSVQIQIRRNFTNDFSIEEMLSNFHRSTQKKTMQFPMSIIYLAWAFGMHVHFICFIMGVEMIDPNFITFNTFACKHISTYAAFVFEKPGFSNQTLKNC